MKKETGHIQRQRQRKMSLAERRYNTAMWTIRKNRTAFTRDDQMEISRISKEIQDYGYNWFPNHYLIDTISKLENLISSKTAGVAL